MKPDTTDLINRLRGHYRTPITDGLGPAGGEEPGNPHEHVRTFPVPPIHKEAAAEIERLREALRMIGLRYGPTVTLDDCAKLAREMVGV